VICKHISEVPESKIMSDADHCLQVAGSKLINPVSHQLRFHDQAPVVNPFPPC